MREEPGTLALKVTPYTQADLLDSPCTSLAPVQCHFFFFKQSCCPRVLVFGTSFFASAQLSQVMIPPSNMVHMLCDPAMPWQSLLVFSKQTALWSGALLGEAEPQPLPVTHRQQQLLRARQPAELGSSWWSTGPEVVHSHTQPSPWFFQNSEHRAAAPHLSSLKVEVLRFDIQGCSWAGCSCCRNTRDSEAQLHLHEMKGGRVRALLQRCCESKCKS